MTLKIILACLLCGSLATVAIYDEYSRSLLEKKSNSQFCKPVYDGVVPRLWVEAGEPRSASTLAFASLLFIAEKVCGAHGMVYGYSKNVMSMLQGMNQTTDQNALHVIKTHELDFTNIPQRTWIFMSGKSLEYESNSTHEISARHGHNVKYVQKLSHTAVLGAKVIYEYKPFFHLSNSTFDSIYKALRLWDILRLCCGYQMSAHWIAYIKDGNNPTNPTVQECLQHNLTQVEVELAETIKNYHVGLFLQPNVSNIGFCQCSIRELNAHKRKYAMFNRVWRDACGPEFVMLEGITTLGIV